MKNIWNLPLVNCGGYCCVRWNFRWWLVVSNFQMLVYSLLWRARTDDRERPLKDCELNWKLELVVNSYRNNCLCWMDYKKKRRPCFSQLTSGPNDLWWRSAMGQTMCYFGLDKRTSFFFSISFIQEHVSGFNSFDNSNVQLILFDCSLDVVYSFSSLLSSSFIYFFFNSSGSGTDWINGHGLYFFPRKHIDTSTAITISSQTATWMNYWILFRYSPNKLTLTSTTTTAVTNVEKREREREETFIHTWTWIEKRRELLMITRTPGFYCISLWWLYSTFLCVRPTLYLSLCVLYSWMLSRSSSCLIGYTLAIDRRLYSSFSILGRLLFPIYTHTDL
jgi:hypothetical protein